MRHFRNTCVFLLFLLLGFQPVAAQLFGDPHTKAELLLSQQAVTPGGELRGAFRLTMDENWHTYWKFAGDVGLPTEAKWELPTGWEASDLKWPVPHYLETEGLVSYAYEGEVLLPFTISVPPDAEIGKTVELKAHLSWLECELSCIPGEADLQGPVEVMAEARPSEQAPVVQSAFEHLPARSDAVEVSRASTDLLITVPPELNDPQVRFFPDSDGQILELEKQTLNTAGKRPVLRVKADPETLEELETVSGVLVVGEGGVEFKADIVNTPSPPVEAASFLTIALTVGAAFLGGIILNLMPCVFPVLSLKVLGIVEQSRSEGRPAWHHGVVFALGVLLSFWVMSGILLAVRAAGQEVGWGYHLQNPVMIGALAILFLLISLNLFGVFEVGENFTQLSGVAEKKEGFAHSFWSGVLTTLAATPCTAPFMGGAIGFALAQPAWVALVIFSALALGVAAPYMTLTLFPALLEKLPKPGAWMISFKQLLAFPMMLAVVWLVWVFGGQVGSDRMALLLLALLGVGFASWVYGRWGSSFEPREQRLGLVGAALSLALALYTGYSASQPPAGTDLWLDYSPELVERLKTEGKPFFLDFTADWCTSCKANELVALSRTEVLDRFKELDVTLVKADWTKKDPVITGALAKFGRAGVPLYVLYPGGGKDPQVLPEVLLPGTVLDALEKVEG